MIVKDSQVEAALNFKGDSDRAAQVQYDFSMREIEAEEAEARAYLKVNEECTVKEREMRAVVDIECMQARREAALAKAELVRFKTKLSKADAIIETWRTESANARGMEMVR